MPKDKKPPLELPKKPKNLDKQKIQKTEKVVAGVIAVLLIFALGFYIGNGQLQVRTYGLLSLNRGQNNGLPLTLNYSALQQEYSIIRENYDGKLSSSQIQNNLETELANSAGDPYTEYFDSSDAKQLNNLLSDTISGVGASLGTNSAGQVVVISPLYGDPAQKAGIQSGDIITSINSKSTNGMNIDTAVADIRGPSGSDVTLGIDRGGTDLIITIKRQTIVYPSVTYKIIDGNMGYIQIYSFDSDTSGLVQAAASSFIQKGVKGIILDLRGDPGGLVTAAVNVSSLWLPSDKTIMIQKHDNKVVQTYLSTGADQLHGIPTVVLIDGGSASASEITAGALQDNGAATLIGEKSFGKGTVQQIYNLSDNAELKVTIAHWFTPDGQSIEGKGITPNVTVSEPSSDEIGGIGTSDAQLSAAESYLQTH